jgi:endo-1,4-beta-xylanase
LGIFSAADLAYAAKFGNPDAKLYLNDYHIIANFGSNSRAYATQIENFLSSGLPIDGIGVQAHVISAKNATPERAQMALDELAKFNLPIKMTECLFGGETEEEIAEQMEIYFPIFFAHPNVEAIIMWNFWAKDHWKPETAMWEEDWTPTSQAKAYRDLVFDEWWTKTSGKADKNGEFKTRGFYGDYIITSNGESKKVILSKKDGTLIVNF